MTTKIERLRADIRTLQAERDSLLAYERNAAETADAIGRAVDAWHADGIALLQQRVRQIAVGSGHALHLLDVPTQYGQPHVASLLAALLGPEALTLALAGLATALPDSPDAAAKRARLAEIGSELDRLENAEEDAIEQSEVTASPIARRADARPEIVLRVCEALAETMPSAAAKMIEARGAA